MSLESNTARELTLVRYTSDLLDGRGKAVPNANHMKLHAVFAELGDSALREMVIQAYPAEYNAWNDGRPMTLADLKAQADRVYDTGIPEDTAEEGFTLAEWVRKSVEEQG